MDPFKGTPIDPLWTPLKEPLMDPFKEPSTLPISDQALGPDLCQQFVGVQLEAFCEDAASSTGLAL